MGAEQKEDRHMHGQGNTASGAVQYHGRAVPFIPATTTSAFAYIYKHTYAEART